MSYFVGVDGKWVRVPQTVKIMLGVLPVLREEGMCEVVRMPFPDTEEAEELSWYLRGKNWDIVCDLMIKYGGKDVVLW